MSRSTITICALLGLAASAMAQQGASTDTLATAQAEEVVVTATGVDRPALDTPLPVNVISAEELARVVPTTMADILHGEPGVDLSSTGSGSVRPMIRGLYDERVLILVDGVRLSEQRPGGNHVLSLDPAQIASVEVVRGPASVLYGSDAVGGVMNVLTRGEERRTDPGWRARLEQDFALESATDGWKSTSHATFGRGRFNGYAGGTYRDAGDIETADGSLYSSFYKGGTFWTGGAWEGDGWRARLGYTRMQADIGIPSNPDVFMVDYFDDETHQQLAGRVEGGPWTVDLGWQRHDRHRTRRRVSPGPAVLGELGVDIEVDLDTWHVQPRMVLEPAPGHTLSTGVQLFVEDASSDRAMWDTDPTSAFVHPFDGIPVIPDASRVGTGVFVQDEWALAERWRLVPGLRFDHIATHSDGHAEHQVSEEVDVDDNAVSGNLGAVYILEPGANLYANVGRAFRAPTLLERFFFGPHDSELDDLGNPDLSPETSLNLDLGLKLERAWGRGQVSVFHNTIHDAIAKVNVDTALAWVNLDDVELYGAELGGEVWVTPSVSTFGTLTAVHAETVDDEERMPSIPPLRARAGLRWNGRPWNMDTAWSEMSFRWSDAVSDPATGERATPSWWTLDMSLGLSPGSGWTMAAAVENLLDEAYSDHLSRTWQDLGVTSGVGRNARVSVRKVF